MRTTLLILVAAAVCAPVWAEDPVSVLKSDASHEQKQAALREISIHGGPETVAVVAPLLLDEQYSHMARYALQPMTCPEAGAALREALDKAEGKLKIGLVHSLGIRKDEQAIPAFIKLLGDADPAVAQAAARALARTDPSKAYATLREMAEKTPDATTFLAFCDAILMAGETGGDLSKAYDALRTAEMPNMPAQVRAGAFRGAVLSRREAGVPLLLEGISGADDVVFDAALRTARELSGPDSADAALAGALAGLQADRKVRLMQVLGERRSVAAGPALMAEATAGETAVRAAALKALTQIAYAPALDMLAQLAIDGGDELSKTARDCLAYFPGDAGDAALAAMLENSRPEVRCAAVEMVGAGGLSEPVAPLMKAAQDADETVRLAALKGLQDAAGAAEVPALVTALEKAASEKELEAVEKALQSLCGRQKRMPGSVVVQKAEYGDLANGHVKDVTPQVAQMVESGATYVDATNANFGDTAPGAVKGLRVEFVQNGAPYTREVEEGETLRFSFDSAPMPVVDEFLRALDRAKGEAKLAVVRLLGSTGHPMALETVQALAKSGDAAVSETAARTLCDWSNAVALPVVMDMSENSADETLKVLALRGAVRLIEQSNLGTMERLAHYADLMDDTPGADGKKAVLGGVAELPSPEAFALALRQAENEEVRAEALQAALKIARELGEEAYEDNQLIDAANFAEWKGDKQYWRVEDGVIIGESKSKLDRNQFLWPGIEVTDFYLAVDVKLEPNTGNGGIQFRSSVVDDSGQALGYQADVGKDVWGRIYHEHGRGKLDWSDRAEPAVKPGDWNRYEILALGPAVWTFINGQLGAAMLDFDGERAGQIAIQLHGGPPQKVQYRFRKFVKDPGIDIEGHPVRSLVEELRPLKK